MSDTRPWIAYVGPIAFPEGGAAARRVLGNAKALVKAGYKVTVVSGQTGAQGQTPVPTAPGIDCVSTSERDAEHLPKALRYSRYAFMGSRSRAWLAAQATPPAAIILYSGYSPYLLQLTGWARRQRIPLLFDAVEWYTAETALGFCTSPYLWNIEIAMRLLIPRCDGVIAISRALERYYSARGVPVCRVPPLVDPSETRPKQEATTGGGPLRLVYAGSPGKKDLLDTVLAAIMRRMSANDGQSRPIELNIAGVSPDELAQQPSIRGRGSAPDYIRAHGRLPHDASIDLVRGADFSVFLRHKTRVSTCGFPTKFVESLAVGTPVITNITSDLGDHLRDGEEGLVCQAPSVDALCHVLERAQTLDADALGAMRQAARAEADRAFTYQRFAEPMGAFIESLRSKTRGRT